VQISLLIDPEKNGTPTFIDLMPSKMRLAFSRHGPEVAARFAIYRRLSASRVCRRGGLRGEKDLPKFGISSSKKLKGYSAKLVTL